MPGLTLSCYARWLDWTSRLVRKGKARVSIELASIFDRLHWTPSVGRRRFSMLSPGKLVGHYFGRLEGCGRLPSVWGNAGSRTVARVRP